MATLSLMVVGTLTIAVTPSYAAIGILSIVIVVIADSLRTPGFSVANSLAAVVGGFTPAIDTWLLHVTADRGLSAAWMSNVGAGRI